MSAFRSSRRNPLRLVVGAVAGAMAFILISSTAMAADPVKLGLVAALSGASAQSGEAITRGLSIALDEINAAGGVLGGRPIELIRRDDESSPPRGVIAARELIFKEKVSVFFGGIDSPVSLAIVPLANKSKVPFMGVWAAATPITRNGANPNYVFRVSAVDAIVDIKLLQYAHQTFGAKKIGLMLINNPWGESNERGLKAADKDNNDVEIVGVETFENGDVDMVAQLTRHKQNGADAIVLVTNAPPGAQMMKSRERMGWDVPVVSHWGISGGRFPELAGPTAGDAHFIQTYSFFGKQSPAGEHVLSALVENYYTINGPEDIFSPVGTANAYDAMHLVAKAIDKAGSTDGDAIRMALESLGKHAGLIKTYDPPFTPNNHDGLNENDYIMVRFVGNTITPVE
ncbi:MAG: ABC transporter substrate-binding protein [Gammaproteobacteria bacterium]|nr:ABC transporter substrate-binding protein [Gammaproteobacteria bacterium]